MRWHLYHEDLCHTQAGDTNTKSAFKLDNILDISTQMPKPARASPPVANLQTDSRAIEWGLQARGRLLVILITVLNEITSLSPYLLPHSSSGQVIRSCARLPQTLAFYYLYIIHIPPRRPCNTVTQPARKGFLSEDS